MGLIKAISGAASGVMADQWKEYFYCEAIPANVLAVKGQKRTGKRSSNKGTDNIITNGSVIAVADGQCMLIVEQGKVVEFTAEPGEFTYNTSTEPSLFAGNLGSSILDTFKTVGKRFTFGGDTAKDQRIYYFNLKELVGNKYGTPSPVPFRVVDRNIGLDWEIGLRCFGEYSYRIADPLLFYTNVCGNVSSSYTRDQLEGQMKTELLTALQPAFARISEMGVRYSSIPGHTMELADALNEILSAKWRKLRGIEIVSFGVSSVKASEEDEAMLKDMQRTAVYGNARMAAAYETMARGDAMKAASSNTAGAMTGFMGMGMAQQAGGNNAAALFQMAAQQEAAKPAAAPADGWKCSCGATAVGKFCPECGSKKPEPAADDSWKCICGNTVIGNFCPECGAKKPSGWVCSCGQRSTGKFCSNCGSKKPEAVPVYKCSNCGFTPADPKNPPKFCPQCGDKFGSEDIVI